MYFPDLSEGTFDPDEVALFSGGIDSFAGALESIVGEGRRTVLVGHHSASKVFPVQKELVGLLKAAGHASRLFYVPINVTNTNIEPAEPTQRSRSFLFASLAFVLAQMFGKDQFTFYENGVVSLNLPIAKDVLGSRATKTTHPKVIRGFERIFSLLAGRPIEIRRSVSVADQNGGRRAYRGARLRPCPAAHGELRPSHALDQGGAALRSLLPMHRPPVCRARRRRGGSSSQPRAISPTC